MKNKEFKSYEHFVNYQKKWAIAGLIFLIFSLIFLFMTFIFADSLIDNIYKSNFQKQIITHEKQFISLTFNKQNDFKEKCEFTSDGLASCFEKLANNSNITRSDNVLSANDGNITLTFIGDGVCTSDKNCKIEYKRKFSQNTTMKAVLYLKADSNGHIVVK